MTGKWNDGPPILSRAKKPKEIPMRSSPCYECGCSNFDDKRVDRCRMCGTKINLTKFTWDGVGRPAAWR